MTTALVTLTSKLAAQFNMGDGSGLVDVLKATAFKSGTQVSDAQMTALLVVANQYGLNPFTREIYAFPDKGGIVPVVGVDGWSRIMNDHPQMDGMEFKFEEESCTCIIYRKDRSHPTSATEYLGECRRDTSPAWKSHPRRMLRHKAMIQAARLAFGFGGIYDQDEAERIVEVKGEVIDGNTGEIRPAKVTPQSASASNVPDGFDQYEADVLPAMQEAAKSGMDSLTEEFGKLNKSAHKSAFWTKHGAALKETAANIVDAEVVQ